VHQKKGHAFWWSLYNAPYRFQFTDLQISRVACARGVMRKEHACFACRSAHLKQHPSWMTSTHIARQLEMQVSTERWNKICKLCHNFVR